MAEKNTPYSPTANPGPDLTTFTVVNASGTSTQSANITLPTVGSSQNGIFDFTLRAYVGDQNNAAVARGTITYVRGAANILSSVISVGPVFTSGSARGVNALTIGNPNTSGVISVGVGWTDASAQVCTFVVTLRRLDLP